MAAGLAIATVNAVVGKLGEIVVNEASLVVNFREDFEWLQTKLTDISGYLQYADEQSASVKQWLSKVSNIALDAEDIVDECAVEPLYTRPTQSCVCHFNQLVFRYKIRKRIKDLKDRMSSTIQKARELNFVHQILHSSQPSMSSSERERGTEMTGWNALEEDLPALGVEEKVEEIVRLLGQPAIGVIAVVGMGGLGKTFLLKHVYDRVKTRYEHSVWISVSQTYSLRTLQSDLASHIGLQISDSISDFRAAQLIHEHLEGKRCLIVLDDVWSSSLQGDLRQKLGLLAASNNRCKILVTTRSRDVAVNMNAHVYEMQRLSKEDSWKLFCLFAFSGLEGNRPPEHLERVAFQVVEECGRLPQGLKTVAASMTNCLGLSDWQSKLRQLKDVTVGAEDSTMQILKLSYDSLPFHLKSCLAYFSFFPEDTHISFSLENSDEFIHQEYVIYLWIAEGFIPPRKDIEQFDVGLRYLQQLQNLSLLEVDRVFACYNIHDLLHDLIIKIRNDHNCEFDLPVRKTSCRRLVLPKKGLTTKAISESSLSCQQFLRTISFSHNPEITSIPEHLFDRLRVLRVLDFSSTGITTLPTCVGKLKLLKVLNLSQTKIRELPDCVRRLKCLEYLDVSRCRSIQCLPDWIGELKSLSYLYVMFCSKELRNNHMPKGILNLSCLRTLRSERFPISSEENEFLNVKDVGNLINLQEISLCLEDENGLRSLENGALERLVKIRILQVENIIPTREGDTEESNLPAFPDKMNVMTNLQQLGLGGFSMPSWICCMVNLTELVLNRCTDYPSLQNMPNLQTLVLLRDLRCRELPKNFGESGGFPKLVRLGIDNFPLLKELPALQEGAMQQLEYLWISNCPLVKKVPKGWEKLRRVKRIDVHQASGELEERLKEGGEDWNKIKAYNPHIEIIFFLAGEIYSI